MEKSMRGNRKIQYLIAFSVSLVSVAMGSFSSWPAPVMPKFHDNETNIVISDSEIAWMVSMSSPGFMTGSFATRFVADRLGRRISLLASVIPVAIGTIIVAFTTQAWLLYVTRFLWGCGTGMNGTIISLYLAEIADKEIRGSLALVTRFMFNFGNLLMMCIGPFVSYTTLNYMLLVLPIGFFAANLWIPESPYYCLKEGKVNEARKILRKIVCKDEKLLEEHLTQMRSDVRNDMRDSSTAKELFTGKKYRKAIWISIGLKLSQIMAGQLLIQQYLGLIMKESGFQMELSTVFIIFGVVRFIVGVMSSVLADLIGRRPLLIYSYLGTGVSLIIVGIYFFLIEVVKIHHSVLAPFGFIPFACIISSNVISTLGFYSVIAVIPAEIFPLNIKAVAMTSLSIFGGLMNFFAARGYQTFKDLTGLCGVFWIFGGSCFCGCIFSALFVPETKGKSLREIQIMLQGVLYNYDETCDMLNKAPIVINTESIKCEELSEIIKNKNSKVL